MMASETTAPVTYRPNELTIPERLRPFAEPALIAGESREDYELLRQLLIEDIQPQTNLEWFWLFDLAELSWEILRYRKLKVRAIEMHRVKAIEALLIQVDGAGLPENDPVPRKYARINSAECRTDPSAMLEVETRLATHGLNSSAVTTVTILQAQAATTLFETLAFRTQDRRTSLLRQRTFLHGNG